MKDDEIKQLEDRFEVETQVRRRAETYAAQMYGDNRAWQKKSMLLSQGKNNEEKLASALNEIEKLSQELEKSKLESKLRVGDVYHSNYVYVSLKPRV